MTPILVCGDAMIDEYWHGDVTRISPEAPVPVVRIVKQESRKGAADNVVANCEAMGADVIENTCFVSRKIRIVGRSQQIARADFDDAPSEFSIKRMEEGFYEALDDVGIVIFSDYGKGSLVGIRNMIQRAKVDGKTVLVDPKGYDYSRYAGADLIKPNTDELRNLVGGWSNVDQMNRKAEALRVQAGVGAILLTRAAEGMALYDATGAYFIKSAAREVFDVTGAGDTAIAAFAVALSRGKDYPLAAWYANKAAGIVVQKFGTATATEEEVFGLSA